MRFHYFSKGKLQVILIYQTEQQVNFHVESLILKKMKKIEKRLLAFRVT